MFDIAPAELLVLGVVAIAVIPPKDLPRAMRVAGEWIGKVRGIGRQFRSGFDEIIRESEIQEMEKKWRAENERIMREHPASALLDGGTGTGTAADEGAHREVAVVPPVGDEHVPDTPPELTPQPAIAASPVMTPLPAPDHARERDHEREVATMAPPGAAELPPLDRST